MAATFVNVTEEFLKQLVDYFLSNNLLSNYTETIIISQLKIVFHAWKCFNNVSISFCMRKMKISRVELIFVYQSSITHVKHMFRILTGLQIIFLA